MTRSDIFKTLINILRSETIRSDMEFKLVKATYDIKEALKNTTLTLMGVGMYSVVVEHPEYPGRVFKVSTSLRDGYRAYAKYCIEHAGEPLLPMVYSAQEHGIFSWYELEKYYPCTLPNLTRTGMVQYPIKKIRDIVQIIQYASYTIGSISKDTIKTLSTTSNMRTYKKREYLEEMNLVSTNATKIYRHFSQNYRLDVHRGNIMITVDNKVIITDPLSHDLREVIPETEQDVDLEDIL